jgi:hypothetical protein
MAGGSRLTDGTLFGNYSAAARCLWFEFLWLFYKKRQKTILFGEAPRENYPEDFNLKAPLTIFLRLSLKMQFF